MKQAPALSVTDWRSAIEDALTPRPGGPPGMTAEEIMDSTGKGSVAVHALLRKLHRDGRLEFGTRPVVNLRGHHVKQLVYSINPVAK